MKVTKTICLYFFHDPVGKSALNQMLKKPIKSFKKIMTTTTRSLNMVKINKSQQQHIFEYEFGIESFFVKSKK